MKNSDYYAVIWYAGGSLYTFRRTDGGVVLFTEADLDGVIYPENRYNTIDGIAVAQGDPHSNFAVPVSALEEFLGQPL